MQADISLIIRLQQKLFADPRRIALLQQIKQTGSISQGAKLAGISYKSAWDAINEMNQLAERTLVERATGGKGGGGAQPLPVQAFSLIPARRSFAGSSIGSIAETQEMLDFCAEHGFGAEIEVIAADQVNEAWERVLASDVRYRFVIDTATLA